MANTLIVNKDTTGKKTCMFCGGGADLSIYWFSLGGGHNAQVCAGCADKVGAAVEKIQNYKEPKRRIILPARYDEIEHGDFTGLYRYFSPVFGDLIIKFQYWQPTSNQFNYACQIVDMMLNSCWALNKSSNGWEFWYTGTRLDDAKPLHLAGKVSDDGDLKANMGGMITQSHDRWMLPILRAAGVALYWIRESDEALADEAWNRLDFVRGGCEDPFKVEHVTVGVNKVMGFLPSVVTEEEVRTRPVSKETPLVAPNNFLGGEPTGPPGHRPRLPIDRGDDAEAAGVV